MNKEELIVLRLLADGICHKYASKFLPEDQFNSTLNSLIEKGMAYTFSKEDGEFSSQIKQKGKEAIRGLYHILENILQKYDISQAQFDIMLYAQKEGYLANIFENMNSSTFKQEVWLKLYNKHLLESTTLNGKKTIKLTHLGEETLTEIEYNIKAQIHLYSDISTDSKDAEMTIVEYDQKAETKDLHIAPGKMSAAISIFKMMHEKGYFVGKNEEKITVKDMMDKLGETFNQKQFFNYSSLLNKACKSQKDTFLAPFYQLEEVAENYYKDTENRKLS